MIAFHDRKGRLWSARLDVAAAVRLRDLVGVDVMAIAVGKEESIAMVSDLPRLADMLFAIVLPQAAAMGVSDRAFGSSLRGRMWGWIVDPLQLADMLLEEVAAFFAVPELLPGQPDDCDRVPVTSARLWGAVWQSASIAGVDPLPHTLGELIALADAKRKHDWAQTASIVAKVHNSHCGRGEGISPAECDPTGGTGAGRRKGLDITPETLGTVAKIFSAVARN